MKKQFLFLLLLLAPTVFAQTTTDPTEAEILKREQTWRAALLNADKKLADIYSKNLSYNDWNGKAHERATLISDVVAGKLKYKLMKATKETVQVTINTAIYECELEIEGNYGKSSISRTVKVLHVWVKETDTWRLIVHQTENLKFDQSPSRPRRRDDSVIRL